MKLALILALALAPPLVAQVTITSGTPLPAGVATVPYSYGFVANGGTTPYTWQVTGAVPLPAGLNLSSDGTLSGTVNVSTVATFTVKVTDNSSTPLSATKDFSLTIAPDIGTTSLQSWTVNRPYPNTSLTVTGLAGTASWSASGLPAGMSISPAGVLGGTPLVSGSVTPTFSVTDSGSGATGSATIPLTINSPPTITDSSPLPSGIVADLYNYQFGSVSVFPVSGGTPPYSWSTPNTLPPLLTLSSSGLLSGTPTQPGLFSFAIQVLDNAGAASSRTFGIVMGTKPVQVTKLNNPPTSTVGVPYPPPPPAAQPPYFQATHGTGAYAWTASGLPPGLGITPPASGAKAGISGTPTASGTFPASVTATDPLNESDTASFTLTINPAPAINTSPLPACTVGQLCSRTLSVTGGTPGFIWTLVGGAVPGGMSFSNTGVISGTPTTAGTATFTVKATDSVTASDTQPLSLTVNPAIVISPATLPPTTSGISYSQTLTVTGGTGIVTLTITGLPNWLSFTGTALSGTAPVVTVPTPYPFSVKATDANSASTTNAYSLVVNPLPSITTATPLPPWTVNQPYSQTITASGGTGTLVFADNGSTLPTGLTISSTGVLSGTPTATGVFPSITLTVTDAVGAMGTKTFSLTINPPPSVSTTTLPATTSGIAYSQALAASGGTAPLTWQPPAPLPWLALSASGTLAGTAPVVTTPTTSPAFSVTVKDAAGAVSAPQALSVTVNPAVQITTTSPLPPTTSGAAYSQQFTASGGTGTITFASPDLPTWLVPLSAAGAMSGIAPVVTVPTPYHFTVVASDSVLSKASVLFTLTVNPAPAITTASPLPSWTVGQPYSQTIIATGGTGTLVFSDNGTLTNGLTISPAGLLSGTPAAAGTMTFSLRVTDSLGISTARPFTLTINPLPVVTTTSLPPAASGASYSQTLAETGGTPSFTWQASGLPGWLTLSAAGVLTGTAPVVTTPTTSPSFSVTVKDAAGAVSAPQSLTITVNPGLQITTPSPLPPTESGLSYSQKLTVVGAVGSVAWSSTTLPQWLSLSTAGVLTGTAPAVTVATPAGFTVTVTDSVLGPVSKPLSLTVYPAVTIATASPLPQWTVGRPYAQTITATGGLGPYFFADAGSTLPPWLSIAGGGALTGTPTASGLVPPFSIKVTDSLGGTYTKPFSLTINPIPSVTTTSLPATTSGRPYSQVLTATGGTPGLTFALQNPPSWLTLSGATLTGTAPLVASSTPFTFTATVTDSTGAVSLPLSLTVTVNPPVQITTANPLPAASSNTFYSVTFTVFGGTGTINWSYSSLPSWLSPSGPTVSGTAPVVTLPTPFSFGVTATDTVLSSNSRTYTVTVNPGVVITNSLSLGPWTATRFFSVTLTAAGGTGPYTFRDAGTTLPSWLPLTGNVLSGTPPAAGTFQFTIIATDSQGVQSPATTFTLTINPVPSVTTTSLPQTTSGATYSQVLSATGGTPPLTWSGTDLGWLTLSGPTLTGTAPLVSSPTPYPFTVTVTDTPGASSVPRALSVTVNPPVTITTVPPLPQAIVGTPYSVTFTATGGTGTLVWSFSGLPGWLSQTGSTVSGTPPAGSGGTAVPITVRATDSVGIFDSRGYLINVVAAGPAITGNLPAWTVNRPYAGGFTATGGTSPYSSWTIASGALPGGLTLDPVSGAVTGTPTSVGTASFTVSVKDSTGQPGSAPFSLTINPAPVIPPQSLPAAAPGVPYSQPVSETGGTAPFHWSATGLDNTGLALNAAGTLAGAATVTPPATIGFTASLLDAAGAPASGAVSLTVGPGVTITTAALPATTSTAHYTATLAAAGGTGTITFSSGSLPVWLSLSPAGGLTGTAPIVPVPTDFIFSATATDTLGIAATKVFTIKVNPVPKVLTTALPAGTIGAPYWFPLSGIWGTGGLTWSAPGLPGWASLNSATGVISGTPTAAGTATVLATATDSLGIASPAVSLALVINSAGGTPVITTLCPLPTTTAGLSVSQTATATGGFPPYSWSAGGLPTWLALSAGGTLSGTAVAGTAAFTLQATDSHNQTASTGCGIAVNPVPAVISTSLAPGTAGTPYVQSLGAAGGTGTLTWSASVLPDWLSIEPLTGILRGTPAVAGTYGLTVLVTDSLGATSAAASFTISVTGPGGVPVITACPLPSGSVGSSAGFLLTAALGSPPYQWSVSGLPGGLTASTAGVVSGTPSAAGAFSVSMLVTDSASFTASASCTMNVFPSLTITTTSLPGGTVSAPYAQPLAASGGVGALRWSGSGIPAWLGLDPVTGILSGTPAAAGSYPFSVQVSDSQGSTSAASLSVNVTSGGVFSISTVCPLPDITESLLLAATFTATGGTPAYSWTASGLPPGISFSPTGALSGAPSAGTISFTVQATDQLRQTASKGCSVKVNPKPQITTPSLPDAVAGTPYSASVGATGGTGRLAWAGGLPYWLSIDPAGGSLSGTPPSAGGAGALVRVADVLGVSNAKTYSFNVAAPGTSGGTSGGTSPTPALTSACPLPGATAGVAYSQAQTAAGGAPPYQYFVSGLPAGMSYTSGGSITGTAQAGGMAQVVVQVIDSKGDSSVATCSLPIAPPLPLQVSGTTPDGKVGQSYSGGFAATGGVPPFTWSVSSGSLPPGVTLASTTGVLGGTPLAAGTYTFQVTVTDLNQSSANVQGTINIAPTLVISTPAALPDAVGGMPYRQQLTVTSAVGAVTWSVAAGALANGLSLDSASGVIAGAATQAGPFQFTVQAVDASGQLAQQKFTLNVTLAALPQLTISGLTNPASPNQQVTAGVTISAGYPLDIVGQLNLTMTADPSIGVVDPAVQFASGGGSVSFRIPANSTQSTFAQTPAFQTGTVAGTLKLDVALQAGGVNATLPSSAAVTAQIPKLAPAIVGTPTVTRNSGAIQVTIIGFATSREITSATFHFGGTNVQNADVTVPLSSLLGGWYSDPQSVAFGSTFKLVQQFTVQGAATQVTSVTITLTNSVGSSTAVTVSF